MSWLRGTETAADRLVREVLANRAECGAPLVTLAAEAAIERVIEDIGSEMGWYLVGLAHGYRIVSPNPAVRPPSRTSLVAHHRGVLEALVEDGDVDGAVRVALADRATTEAVLARPTSRWQRELIAALCDSDDEWACALARRQA